MVTKIPKTNSTNTFLLKFLPAKNSANRVILKEKLLALSLGD